MGASRVMDRRVKRSECFVRFAHYDWRGLMSTLEVETDIKKTVQATDTVRVIDCGRASERTQGVPILLLFELGVPPSNKLFLL